MRLIIEARVDDDEACATDATIVAVVERDDRSLADLGLTLAEGRTQTTTRRRAVLFQPA